MPQKLTETALLMCDKGTLPSQLKVTSQDFCRVDDKLVATEKDKQTETNIQSFGVCSITRSRCTPNVVAWQKTAEKDDVNDAKILSDSSTCQCVIGGKISVKHKGHSELHDVE